MTGVHASKKKSAAQLKVCLSWTNQNNETQVEYRLAR